MSNFLKKLLLISAFFMCFINCFYRPASATYAYSEYEEIKRSYRSDLESIRLMDYGSEQTRWDQKQQAKERRDRELRSLREKEENLRGFNQREAERQAQQKQYDDEYEASVRQRVEEINYRDREPFDWQPFYDACNDLGRRLKIQATHMREDGSFERAQKCGALAFEVHMKKKPKRSNNYWKHYDPAPPDTYLLYREGLWFGIWHGKDLALIKREDWKDLKESDWKDLIGGWDLNDKCHSYRSSVLKELIAFQKLSVSEQESRIANAAQNAMEYKPEVQLRAEKYRAELREEHRREAPVEALCCDCCDRCCVLY